LWRLLRRDDDDHTVGWRARQNRRVATVDRLVAGPVDRTHRIGHDRARGKVVDIGRFVAGVELDGFVADRPGNQVCLDTAEVADLTPTNRETFLVLDEDRTRGLLRWAVVDTHLDRDRLAPLAGSAAADGFEQVGVNLVVDDVLVEERWNGHVEDRSLSAWAHPRQLIPGHRFVSRGIPFELDRSFT